MKCGLKFIFLIYGYLFSFIVHASETGMVYQTNTSWHGVLAVGGGLAGTLNLGQNQIFPIINPITDEFFIYSPNHRNQTEGLYEVFIGAEHLLFNEWLLQGGLAYAQTGSYSAKGTFVQGADSHSQDQYDYQFRVNTKQLLVQTKWMYPYQQKYYPYFLLGVGASSNATSNSTTSVPPFLSFTRTYLSQTTSSFAYCLGLGIDVRLTHSIRMGIAYRFASLGGVKLGAASINNERVGGTLSQSNLYANEGLIQVSYIL